MHRPTHYIAYRYSGNKAKKLTTLSLLFLCMIFLLSSVMTSLAWYDFNQTKTNVFRGTVDNVTVVLHKTEKDANGVIRANPVAPVMNAGFQLYRIEAGGTETLLSGGPWYTDATGKIIFDGRDENHPKLDTGRYCFVETSPAFGYTYDKDEAGNDITRYEFEVTQADVLSNRTITVSAYNRRGSGTLAIKKTVAGNPPANEAFTFTVTFSDNGRYSYSIDGGAKISIASGGTLTLEHGQTALFVDIPIGVQYRIVEHEHPNYVVSATGHQGNITEAGSVASFVNTYHPAETGRLTVTKEVKGDGADTNKVFEFTAVIGGETTAFSLKSGEQKTFEGLPVGTEYTITEKDYSADGYAAPVKEYSGTLTDAETVILPFINVYSAVMTTGNLTVSKQVKGNGADPNKIFTFEVTFEGEDTPQSPQSFTLKDGESKIFTDIPSGVSYTVRETNTAGYIPDLNVVSGDIASDETAAITFRNRVPENTTKLNVTKKLAGEYPKADANKEFAFTLIIDGEELTFTLKPSETKEFEVPQGAEYEIFEADYFADGYEQFISKGFGTAVGEEINIIVTNTFIGEPVIDIEGEKKWILGGNTDVILPESITVRLKNGDITVAEQVVRPDTIGDWKYSFTAPKYDANGDKIKYTVEELPVSCFIPSYNGYNITNTYIAPVEADPPIVTKIVQGENVPETKFSFIMKGLDGAPMPDGSIGDEKTVFITGEGEVEFGYISFTMPGTYRYSIQEKNGGTAGWTYDSAEYTLTFTVTAANGKLVVSDTAIERSGKTAEKVQFTNSYTEPVADTVTIAGKKIWEHGTNPVNNQPENIILYVCADGRQVVQWQLGEQDNWEFSFELPKFAEDGHEIHYTVDEADVAGYDKSIDGFNLINTYTGKSDDPFTPPDPSDSPGTGDGSNLLFWFILMFVSGTLLVTLSLLCRKMYRGGHSKQ